MVNEIRWEKTGKGETAHMQVWYQYEDGSKIQGTMMREMVKLAVGPEGQWAVAYDCGSGMKIQSVGGQEDTIEQAKAAAIAAVPDFARKMYVRQPSGKRRVPVF